MSSFSSPQSPADSRSCGSSSGVTHRARRLGGLAAICLLAIAIGGGLAVVKANGPDPADQSAVGATATAGGDQDADAQAIRIGTYDSRAVAVAYVRSKLSAEKLKVLIDERAAAEKAGNTRRVKELNELGASLQRRRHLQGFSTAPIEDILDVIRDRLPGVAEKAGVDVITRSADWHGAGVEFVDVTDALVGLLEPDAQTVKMIAELRKQQPAAIETIAEMPAKH